MSSRAGAFIGSGSKTQLAALMSATCLSLFAGTAVWLLMRRLSGAFSQPLSGIGLLLAVVVIALGAALLRRLRPAAIDVELGPEYERTTRPAIAFVPTIAAIVGLAALTVSGTPLWAMVVAWLILLGGETATWWPEVRLHFDRLVVGVRSPVDSSEPEPIAEEDEIPAGLVQRITRVREEEGESIHILASTEIPAGDRIGIVYISFCPPLASRPELSAHAMEADDVEVRITQVESFGARVEVRTKQDQSEPRRVIAEILGSVTDQKSA